MTNKKIQEITDKLSYYFDECKEKDLIIGKFIGWLLNESNLVEAGVSDDFGEQEYEPYFGWCDVEGCENEACGGGIGWRETGYWKLCDKHSDDYRKGKPQPKMKQEAIDRENSRDKQTGYLPSVSQNLR